MLAKVIVVIQHHIAAVTQVFCLGAKQKGGCGYLEFVLSTWLDLLSIKFEVQLFSFRYGFPTLVPRYIENDVHLFPHPMINKASRHIVDAVHLEFPITLLYVLIFSLVRRLVIYDVRYTAGRGDLIFHLFITIVEIDVWHLVIVKLAVFSVTKKDNCNYQKQFSCTPLQRLLFLLIILRILILLKELSDCHDCSNPHDHRCCRVIDRKHSFCKHRIYRITKEIHHHPQHLHSPFLFFSSVTL